MFRSVISCKSLVMSAAVSKRGKGDSPGVIVLVLAETVNWNSALLPASYLLSNLF